MASLNASWGRRQPMKSHRRRRQVIDFIKSHRHAEGFIGLVTGCGITGKFERFREISAFFVSAVMFGRGMLDFFAFLQRNHHQMKP